MLNLNQITLAGNLGGDLEVKTLEGGRQVGRFRLAVNTQWKGADGQRQGRTDWFNCVLWNPTEGARTYLTKGTNVWLQGEVRVRVTEEATYHDVVVRQWRLINRKTEEATTAIETEEPGVEAADEPDGDLDPGLLEVFEEEAPKAKKAK